MIIRRRILKSIIEQEEIVYEFVDLGLPSGLLWSKQNVGAKREFDYGNYYGYGQGAKTYVQYEPEYEGEENPLDSSVDTATQVMGSPWRMPTRAEFEELFNNTTYTWITNFNGTGVNGGMFTALNGEYVFFPAAGEMNEVKPELIGTQCSYRTSTPKDSYDDRYASMGLYNNQAFSPNVINEGGRYSGMSVRGVRDN